MPKNVVISIKYIKAANFVIFNMIFNFLESLKLKRDNEGKNKIF